MIVTLGADHRGFHLKERLKGWLMDQGYTVDDTGAPVFEKEDDYTVYAKKVADTVRNAQMHSEEVFGVLLCGGGTGMVIAANKFPGVRCGHGITPEQVIAARNDDDMNVLALASDFLTEQEAERMLHAFLTTPFSGQERHRRRVAQIKQFEERTS